MGNVMLKIRKLKIDIKTLQNKNFGALYEFKSNKLNLIKGNNHSGKTTIVSSLFYALGMEELFGGQNTKALDSILTSVVPFNNKEYQINESKIYLEIENANYEIITIKRYIKHVDIEPKIAYIYETNLSNVIDEEYTEVTYLHDSGSAQNNLGFYKYLANYLNYNLPHVPSYSDKEIPLYLQVVFNAFFVEQLQGWSDFFATIPNFGTKEPKKRIVEFLLKLDASEFEKDKFKYEEEKERIKQKWFEYITAIKLEIELISAQIDIEYMEPISIDKFQDSIFNIYFIDRDNERIPFKENFQKINKKLNELNLKLEKPQDGSNEKLFNIRKKIQIVARKISKLNQIIEIKTSELSQLKNDFSHLEKEITKLTDLQKIEKYTKNIVKVSQILKGICPTCEQSIDSSFYSSKLDIMSVDDNKEYLVAQKKVLKVYIEASQEEIEKQKELIKFLNQEYEERQNIIKYLEKDITLNTNMAIYKEIVDLDLKVKSYKKIGEDILLRKNEISHLAQEWKTNEMNKSTYEMSFQDSEKIKMLEKYFKKYLFDFRYGSKDFEQINISKSVFEKYFPIVKIDGKAQKIRINSSASDFVRSLWAYYISLFEVSKEYSGNHLGLFIFDEPAQHAMDESSQKAFLERLSKLANCQSIVFSSFEDKGDNEVGKEKFKNMIEGIDKSKINIIEIDGYSIKEIN